MLEQVEVLTGSQAQQATADAGCFSEKSVTDAKLEGIDLWVAPDRQKHGEEVLGETGPPWPVATVAEQMRHKLRTPEGRAIYKMRKAVVEPVFLADQRAARVSEISAARTSESGGEMEDGLRHAQSTETLPIRMESTECRKELTQPTKLLFRAALSESKAHNPTLGDRGAEKRQDLEKLISDS